MYFFFKYFIVLKINDLNCIFSGTSETEYENEIENKTKKTFY